MSEPTLPPFEGPEKTLEIDFVPTIGHESGLRALPLSAWEDIVSHAKAQILNHEKNNINIITFMRNSKYYELLIKTKTNNSRSTSLPYKRNVARCLQLGFYNSI